MIDSKQSAQANPNFFSLANSWLVIKSNPRKDMYSITHK